MKHLLIFRYIYLIVLLLVVSDVTSQKVYHAEKIPQDISVLIDGRPDDAAWKSAEWSGGFVETRPAENTAPRFQTQIKALYDEGNVYFAIRCSDSAPDSIVRRLSRRDGFQGDRVNIILDSYYDKRTAFIFTVTAAGVKGDEIVTGNGDNIDDSWNPIWYADAHIDTKGWTGEMKIPLSQLRFGNSEEQIWGLNVSRMLFREEERSAWNRVPADAPGFVSECGILRGLKGLKPQRQVEIQPFIVTHTDVYTKEQGNPYRTGNDFGINAGLDAKVGITNDLTLDLTINPDFGQVEADPGAISLDGFQIFYEEQRPFFVENKNIFDFQFGKGYDNLFYSRRIGRAPQGIKNTNGLYRKRPKSTRILGASKFSGKTKDGWSIGILESITAKEHERYTTAEGKEHKIAVEPMTNYLIGRLQKDFNNKNSYLGGIITATNRFSPDGQHVHLATESYSGGVDFKHQWLARTYYIQGNLVGSTVAGNPIAITRLQSNLTHLYQRVDAEHLTLDRSKKQLSGTGGKLEIGKAGSGNWRYKAGLTWKSPGLELNDIGFLRQADEIDQYNSLSYRILQPTSYFRTFDVEFETSSLFDFGGNYNKLTLEAKTNFSLNNRWSISMGTGYKPFIYLNAFLRGGPRMRFSSERFIWGAVTSDKSKKVWSKLGYVYSTSEQQHFQFKKLDATINYQPLSALSLSMIVSYEAKPNKAAYVTQRTIDKSPVYILGALQNQEISTALRINYSINPDLSIQYYASPYHARGRYSKFNYVTDPQARSLYQRVKWFDEDQVTLDDKQYTIDLDKDGTSDGRFPDPNFNYIQYRSNLVMRWEYIPGSELFLVWSQGSTRHSDGSQSLLQGLENSISSDGNHTFLVKYTYRFRR